MTVQQPEADAVMGRLTRAGLSVQDAVWEVGARAFAPYVAGVFEDHLDTLCGVGPTVTDQAAWVDVHRFEPSGTSTSDAVRLTVAGGRLACHHPATGVPIAADQVAEVLLLPSGRRRTCWRVCSGV